MKRMRKRKMSLKGDKSHVQVMKNPLQEEPKMLSDIYQRCNFVRDDKENNKEALKPDVCKKAFAGKFCKIKSNIT